MKPKVYILCGIPCSGKSKWASEQGLPIISCDQLRLDNSYNGVYKFSPHMEDYIWNTFYERLKDYHLSNFIIDNTNCKDVYIKKILEEINPGYEVYIKKFPISLNKAYYRNILRYLKTGKWIPFKVIKNMKRNFSKLTYKEGQLI